MKIPVEAKPAFWGAVGGAIAMAVVGFNWGGWVTGGTAEQNANRRAEAAVVAALAPACLERFDQAPDAAARRATLMKTDSWSQGEFVEKGGWAKLPGKPATEHGAAIAKACAALITGA